MGHRFKVRVVPGRRISGCTDPCHMDPQTPYLHAYDVGSDSALSSRAYVHDDLTGAINASENVDAIALSQLKIRKADMAIFTLVATKFGACGGVGPRTAGGPFLARPSIRPGLCTASVSL